MVPAAAVIPSPIAFLYVAAIKTSVADFSIAYHPEKFSTFIVGMPLHSTAGHDILPLGKCDLGQCVACGISGGQVK